MEYKHIEEKIFAGTAGKRVVFQPRINCWYDDKKFLGEELPMGLDPLTKPDMYRALGVTNRLYEFTGCFERIYDKSVEVKFEQLGEREYKYGFVTPVGECYTIYRGNDSNPGTYYTKWMIESEDDMRVKTYVDEATDYVYHPEVYEALSREWEGLGAPTMYICRTPIQEAYVETMGVENATYALYDSTELMEKYFDAKEESNHRMIREILKSPINIINYGDNIHCGLTSPDLFERYIIPVYERRYPLLHNAGKFVHSHWDGDVKSILPYAQKCFLDGIEALTPTPQGDVEVKEMLDALGDMVMLDGVAALLFEDRFPLSQLEDQVMELIEAKAGRLILGISDEMPSKGNIERVCFVRDLVNKYNEKL